MVEVAQGADDGTKRTQVRGTFPVQEFVKRALGDPALFRKFAHTDPEVILQKVVERPDKFVIRDKRRAHESVNWINLCHIIDTIVIIPEKFSDNCDKCIQCRIALCGQ
jgi:hypothetical protein